MSRPRMEEQIETIMDEFDFGSVVAGMRYLGMGWASTLNIDGIPTVAEVKNAAQRLLQAMADKGRRTNDGACIQSGCLTARRDDGWLSLEWAPLSASAELYMEHDDPPA